MVRLNVEIADNSLTLAQGLMKRTILGENDGMLFKLPYITEARFWGKDTYLPLDIAFINDNEIIDIKSITPMSTKVVISSQPCNMAIETNAGWFSSNHIGVGTKIKVQDKQVDFLC